MSEFSQLSKEEQEAILRMRKKTAKPPQDSPTESDTLVEICKYVAGKGGKEKCTEHSGTPYGFCKKHSRTVQAKKAREEYESNECTTATCSTISKIPEKVNAVIKEEPKKTTKTPVPVKEEKPKKQAAPVKEEKPKKQAAPIKEEPKKTTKQPTSVKEETTKKIVKQSTKGSQSLHKEVIRSKKIHPNHWGRFEDPVTHIVFDKNTKEAYGIQEPSGKVSALKQEHIQICIRNKWNYNLPYASDDEESDSIHESDFDEDEELSESEEESLEESSEENDEDGEEVDELVDSDENSGDDSDEELVDSDEESDDDDSDEEDDDDSDEDDDDDDSDDSR